MKSFSDESRVEFLKHRMGQVVNQKARRVQNIEKMIFQIEDVELLLHRELREFNRMLRELREKRETIEINCFKEIVKMHREIQRLTTRINGIK